MENLETPSEKKSGRGLYLRIGKRSCDIIGSLIALPAVAVISIPCALAIKLDDGGSVLFKQERRGRDGKPFSILKFRTMSEDAKEIRRPDHSVVNAANDPRVTRVGRILRKTSLDEIPQIINVLRGDMSFIGPRPDLNTRSLAELSDLEKIRLRVRPGITGLSQALYRNSLPAGDRYKIDAQYVEQLSVKLDCSVLARTVGSVLGQKNIYT